MEEFSNFWFEPKNQHYWFNCSKKEDKVIYQKFNHIIITNHDISNLNQDTLFNMLLVYDQLYRHIARHLSLQYPQWIQEKAITISQYLLNMKYDLQLSPPRRCFLLMPLRHSFRLPLLNLVHNKLIYYRLYEPNNAFYRRFYYATIKSIANIITPMVQPSIKVEFFNPFILCQTSKYISDHISNKIPKNWSDYFIKLIPKREKLIISLSGGVDSMVCSYIAKELGYDTIAIMINYNNREESVEEQQFVEWWCSQLDIPIYVRKIDEISRNRDNTDDRHFYEEITKKIRFDMYSRFPDRKVILGHNYDDTLENIFTNIRKQRSLDNLLGMTKISVISNVTIYRPLLEVPKKEIYQFASNNNIPYLFDSTPNWSDRGKMRDELIPFISKFDAGILTGLVALSKNYQELYQIIDEQVIRKTIITTQPNGNIEIKYNGNKSFIFWKKIFQKIQISISNKSINNLIEQIVHGKLPKRINLGKSISCILNMDILQIILVQK